MRKRKESFNNKISAIRKSLQKSSQNGFIIGLTQPRAEAESEKDRWPSQFQEIEHSRIEIAAEKKIN